MKIFGRRQNQIMENRLKPEAKERQKGRRRRDAEADSETEPKFSGNSPRDNKGGGKFFRPLAALGSFLDGSVLTNTVVVRNIPFLLFITVLAFLYITNSAMAERDRRESARVSEELKELRYKYISVKSSVMYLGNQSQISLKLKDTGVRESVVPPVKIFVSENEPKP